MVVAALKAAALASQKNQAAQPQPQPQPQQQPQPQLQLLPQQQMQAQPQTQPQAQPLPLPLPQPQPQLQVPIKRALFIDTCPFAHDYQPVAAQLQKRQYAMEMVLFPSCLQFDQALSQLTQGVNHTSELIIYLRVNSEAYKVGSKLVAEREPEPTSPDGVKSKLHKAKSQVAITKKPTSSDVVLPTYVLRCDPSGKHPFTPLDEPAFELSDGYYSHAHFRQHLLRLLNGAKISLFVDGPHCQWLLGLPHQYSLDLRRCQYYPQEKFTIFDEKKQPIGYADKPPEVHNFLHELHVRPRDEWEVNAAMGQVTAKYKIDFHHVRSPSKVDLADDIRVWTTLEGSDSRGMWKLLCNLLDMSDASGAVPFSYQDCLFYGDAHLSSYRTNTEKAILLVGKALEDEDEDEFHW